MENNKSQCIEEINNIFCKYNDNPWVTDKILYYIKKELPELSFNSITPSYYRF